MVVALVRVEYSYLEEDAVRGVKALDQVEFQGGYL